MSHLWMMLRRSVIGHRPLFIMTTYEDALDSSLPPTIEETSSASTNPDASAALSPWAADKPYNGWDPNTEVQMTASTSASTSETAASNTPADTETKTLNHVLRLLPEPATYDSPGLTITTTLSSTSTTTAGSATSTITHAPDSEPNSDPSSAEGSHSGVNKSKLAVALPISIAGLLIIGLVWFYLRRRRRRRDAQPTFDMATSQTTAVSASELMIVPKVATPEPAVSSQPHLPVRDVHPQQSHEPSPGPASARTPHDSNTELGLAVAVPMNRMSLTEYGSRGLGKPNSRVGAGAMGIRLPFRDDDEDAVSVVSGLNEHRNQGHDFDELSSVSSFNDGDDDHHSWN